MSHNYDNWERLVTVVLRRKQDKQLALDDSRDPSSIGSPSSLSTTSNFSYISSGTRIDHDHSHTNEVPMDYSDITLDHIEWKAMLPPDKHEVVWRSASLSFFLDKRTRKHCVILGAMKLVLSGPKDSIGYCEIPADAPVLCWEKKSHPKSRFPEVAELLDTPWFAIQARIPAEMWSPETSYAAYLVFGLTENYQNLESAVIYISYNSLILETQTRVVQFQSRNNRADGWIEVKMGSFYIRHDKNTEIQVILRNRSRNMNMNSGLIVEGIEFRPVRTKGIFSKFRISSKASDKTLEIIEINLLFYIMFNCS